LGVTDYYDRWYEYYDVESAVRDNPSVISELIQNIVICDIGDEITLTIHEIRCDFADKRRFEEP